jgi:hypothetical protein
MIALPSDVARATPRARGAYQNLVGRMAGVFEKNMPQQNDHPSRATALALTALCVGGMVLARTLNDAGFGNEIREAARTVALELSGCQEAQHMTADSNRLGSA